MKLNTIFQDLIFATLLSVVVTTFVYFGFANIYSSEILNFRQFSEQFQSGIYQHRILSGWLLLAVYDFLGTLNPDYEIFRLKFLNPAAEPRFFIALFLLNTFFAVLTAKVATVITHQRFFSGSQAERILIIAVIVLTIALTQFVIVPYDISSYFFLLLFILFFMRYVDSNMLNNLIFPVLLIVISTLNRESSALSLSFAAAVLFVRYGIRKEMILPLAILALSFIATYAGIRFFSDSFTTNDGNLLVQNFTDPKNWLGIMFWLIFFLFTLKICNTKTNRKLILWFHIFSLPYIVMCFYTGILYEARLYVPLFITSVFLAKFNLNYSAERI